MGSPKRFRFVVLAFIITLLLGAYALFLWLIPPARISVVLSARSEFVRFVAINPEFAAIRVVGMKALAAGEDLSGCMDAIVTPQIGARIEYRRGSVKYFRIRIDGRLNGGTAFLLRMAGAKPREISQSVVFEASDECSGDPPDRLPYGGPLNLAIWSGLRAQTAASCRECYIPANYLFTHALTIT